MGPGDEGTLNQPNRGKSVVFMNGADAAMQAWGGGWAWDLEFHVQKLESSARTSLCGLSMP